jgi:colicin import membrane protein
MSAAALHRPPSAEGFGRGFGLALLAHAFLVWALAFGVNWRSNTDSGVAEAELWAAVPRAAAPAAVEPPPEPKSEPKPEQRVEPKLEPKPDPEVQRAQERVADIAERKERERERKKLAERKAEEERKEARLERERRDKAEKNEKAEEQRKAKAEEARREAQRQENLRRMQSMAGGTGSPNATGSAAQAAGPSVGYAGRIKARIKPNITLTETLSGNPQAEVEVRTAPDGLILARRLIKKSGDDAWDAAVLRAIDKTERLPRDEDGRVPPVFVISFRPND